MKNIHCLLMLFAFLFTACEEEIDPYIEITSSSNIDSEGILCGHEGISHTVSLASNVDWSVMSPNEWIRVSPQSGESGTFTVVITISSNKSINDRYGNVQIKADIESLNINVSQDGLQELFEATIITTGEATNIAATAASISGVVASVSDVAFIVLSKGICYGTEPNPTVESKTVTCNTEQVSWVGTLDRLTPATTYYARAYATIDTETIYGNEVSFTTINGSPDNSLDGNVNVIQSATVGDGIDIIIMGDGFTNSEFADGSYAERVNVAIENIFEEEPMKTLRNRFNVYSVMAVSKNNFSDDEAETAFSSNINYSLITGDDEKVFKYAKKIQGVSGKTLRESVVIVILNTPSFAGTCWMYSDNSAIAYCTYGENNVEFSQLINHEAIGHGFGKLEDEYSVEVLGSDSIPEKRKAQYIRNYSNYGWGANVDVTNDPRIIHWSHFLNDSMYAGLVGIYEGGISYCPQGVWRSTENSIMNGSVSGFNPPSREAIYKRAMELSGATYSYADFRSYDAINRKVPEKSAYVNRANFEPCHPPVFVRK